jgi:hypothetical protein
MANRSVLHFSHDLSTDVANARAIFAVNTTGLHRIEIYQLGNQSGPNPTRWPPGATVQLFDTNGAAVTPLITGGFYSGKTTITVGAGAKWVINGGPIPALHCFIHDLSA